MSRLLPWVALFLPLSAAAASDRYIPYIEPLHVAQQRTYVAAAPQGDDASLEEASPEVVMPIAGLTVGLSSEVSRVEQVAEDRAGPLSLAETQQQQAGEGQLKQFGYDIFNRAPSTFAPVDGIPVPPNYRVGPGDNLIVQLYGKRNVEYKLLVTRDGNILVPEYGPIKVSGMTFDEVEAMITEGFERRVIGARAVVTMGRLRSIQLRLAGDVVQPGVYTIGGLSTLVDALLSTGGVRETGSLRRIQLLRNGQRIATLDLYDLLLRGGSGTEHYLRHNDTIFVPPLGEVVYVTGDVQRPGIYELLGETTIGQVLAMAGGLLPTASLEDSHIERIQPQGYRTLVDFSAAGGDQAIRAKAVRNGDFLRVLPLEDQLESVVLLSGHVDRPGGYQYRDAMRFSDLIGSAEALLPGADMAFYLIRRENPVSLRSEVLYGDLTAALEQPGGSADLTLAPRDQVFIFDLSEVRENTLADIVEQLRVQATESRPAAVVSVRGALRQPGNLPLQVGARLLDVVALGGGLLPRIDMHYGIYVRTRSPGRYVEAHAFSLAAARENPLGSENPVIEPGDRVYFFSEQQARSELLAEDISLLREQALYGAPESIVTVLGEARLPGTYPMVPDMRASDLLCGAGGLARKAWGVTAELSRIGADNTGSGITTHTALDSVELLAICDLKRRSERGEISREQYLAAYTAEVSNPRLQPLDQLAFSEKPGWVEQATVVLSGEVQRPGTYAIDRHESLCSVLQRAGGLTVDAYAYGAYFTRNSVREMQQETIDELHGQLDDLMVELSLSHSFNNDGKSAPEWAGKQDYLKAIRQLEKAEANGRMVVDMDKVQRCRSRDELALEDGDALVVPRVPDYVQVAGQVYVPTSHLYSDDRNIKDYVELSGGSTVLGKLDHAYVIQANGEVLNLKGGRNSSRMARKSVMPGARIYVPLNVDRMNGTERAQTWVQTLVNSAILAGIVL
ncbi:polysialic acid transporter [Halioglobus maricola]|uniref:Polysialic acid transporter n=2 Tax=Halioglobus maricola TaxID=2601894 RepID=A0A5P9NQ76_9GAMM|nr:polysialic acid transporter [Halioglobus maricola]